MALTWQDTEDRTFRRGEGPPSRSTEALLLPQAYETGSMLVIASTILHSLVVAAVGGGGLILLQCLRSRIDILAASPLLGSDGSVAALSVSAIS